MTKNQPSTRRVVPDCTWWSCRGSRIAGLRCTTTYARKRLVRLECSRKVRDAERTESFCCDWSTSLILSTLTFRWLSSAVTLDQHRLYRITTSWRCPTCLLQSEPRSGATLKLSGHFDTLQASGPELYGDWETFRGTGDLLAGSSTPRRA
jgi:hypothetical protein